MLFEEILAVYTESYIKPVTVKCRDFTIAAGGAYS
jgi:hypothetical protein